ncbi:MAG: tripartite tricarboxylate transporter substrate binding protein [Burkholderiales bacterium]|nr:tripartite tricarboxylate transporter substrate binding protein [Burkholderiales bacterium]
MPCLRLLSALGTLLVALGHVTAVRAQEYPGKPVRIVLAFAAGAGGDVFMRVVAEQFSILLGQPVIIDNRAGAGGVVATEAVIRSAPDGYTLLGATPNSIITRRFLSRSNTIEWERDLTPITALWNTQSLVLVSSSLAVSSLRELIAYARANPNKVQFGTTGIGTHHHFNAEQIMQRTGAQFLHVPYKANAQAYQDLVGGSLPMVIGIAESAQSFLKTGRIRVLAVVEYKSNAFPGVPAVADVVPGFEPAPSWTGLFGPARLPEAVLRRLSSDILKAVDTPQVRSRQGFDIIGDTPEAFIARIRRETALLAGIVKAAHIQPVD